MVSVRMTSSAPVVGFVAMYRSWFLTLGNIYQKSLDTILDYEKVRRGKRKDDCMIDGK